MTTFGNFDMEYMMRGRMVDLPTFDTYNVQYQPPTSALPYEPTTHYDTVYAASSLQHCGSLSPDGDSPSFDNDHAQRPQIHAPRSSAAATPSPYFWESGGISEGTFERTAYAAASTATAGIPSSVVQWHIDYLQPPELHFRAPVIDPPPQAGPFQMSPSYATQGMDSLPAAQLPPAESCIPDQLVYPFRHTFIPQHSVPNVGTTVNHASIHLAAHQPVPPECQSTYSTLVDHVEFLEKLRLEDSTKPSWNRTSPSSVKSHPQPLSASSSSSNKRPRSPSTSVSYYAVSFPDNRTSISGIADPDVPDTWTPTQLMVMGGNSRRGSDGSNSAKRARLGDSSDLSLSLPSQPPPSSPAVVSEPMSVPSAVTIEEAPPATKHPKNVKEPRKPSLACLFCRERKIGCGRPPEGSEDMTCNQCARRKFVCVYMAEKPPRVRRRPVKAKLLTT